MATASASHRVPYAPSPVRPEDLQARPIDPEIARLRRFAEIFDAYLVDPILGFFLPGVGDIVSSALGLWIVVVAARRGVAPIVLARMLLNLGIDAVMGVIPIAGDIADIGFKANAKNVSLLEQRGITGKGKASDWALVGVAVVGLIGLVVLVGWIVSKLWHAVASYV